MEKMKSAITWFEIMVENLDRAVPFYETVLERKLTPIMFGAERHALFTHGPEIVGGALVERGKNGSEGALVYFDCGDDLKAAIARSEKAGGKTVGDVVVLPDNMGSYVHVTDTEGNRVGLHASA